MIKVKADLHNHLRTRDTFKDEDFNKAIDRASKKLGRGGIFGLINFNDERKYEEFIGLKGYYERDYLGENKNGIYVRDNYVVKGQEVQTKEGHLLVLGLGYDKRLKPNASLEDTIKEAKDNNGILIAEHPFYAKGISIGECLIEHPHLLNDIDAIEVYNGEAAFGLPFSPFSCNANKKALKFYEVIKELESFPNIGALSSSDGHSMYELGSNWTEIDKPEINNFVNSLRESIRRTNEQTNRKNKKLILGAIDHIADLTFIKKIAPKLGLNFQSEIF
jgi:hypothetical protein